MFISDPFHYSNADPNLAIIIIVNTESSTVSYSIDTRKIHVKKNKTHLPDGIFLHSDLYVLLIFVLKYKSSETRDSCRASVTKKMST